MYICVYDTCNVSVLNNGLYQNLYLLVEFLNIKEIRLGVASKIMCSQSILYGSLQMQVCFALVIYKK